MLTRQKIQQSLVANEIAIGANQGPLESCNAENEPDLPEKRLLQLGTRHDLDKNWSVNFSRDIMNVLETTVKQDYDDKYAKINRSDVEEELELFDYATHNLDASFSEAQKFIVYHHLYFFCQWHLYN